VKKKLNVIRWTTLVSRKRITYRRSKSRQQRKGDKISYHARFEALASVLKIYVVRDMTRCRLVHGNRCSGVACCLHLHISPRTIDCHEYEGSKKAAAEASLIICKSTERYFWIWLNLVFSCRVPHYVCLSVLRLIVKAIYHFVNKHNVNLSCY
jgi:hypothetical protein